MASRCTGHSRKTIYTRPTIPFGFKLWRCRSKAGSPNDLSTIGIEFPVTIPPTLTLVAQNRTTQLVTACSEKQT